jgi:hypothetical protein
MDGGADSATYGIPQRHYYKSARLEKAPNPVKKRMTKAQSSLEANSGPPAFAMTIEKTLPLDRNFLLDTAPLLFLTFHNSRKVRRNLQRIIGFKGAQAPGVTLYDVRSLLC